MSSLLPGEDPEFPGRIIIRSADDAWELLKHAQEGGELPENLSLEFDGWPRFEMTVNGRDWHGTVPTRIMAPLLEVQRDIYRVYANVYYGAPNLRRLRDDERDLLEIVVKVKEGSSGYDAPLWEQLSEVAKKAIDRMDSRDVVITVLGIAVIIGGVEVNKAWVAERQEAKQLEQTVELSKQETERLKIFSGAVKQKPVLSEIREDYQESQNRLLKAVRPTDSVAVKGVALRGDQVAEITHTERAQAREMDISGVFRVLSNDAMKGAGFRIKVARVDDGLTLMADVPLELDADQKRIIQKAEWSKGTIFVQLNITASVLRDSITNAVVYGAKAVP